MEVTDLQNHHQRDLSRRRMESIGPSAKSHRRRGGCILLLLYYSRGGSASSYYYETCCKHYANTLRPQVCTALTSRQGYCFFSLRRIYREKNGVNIYYLNIKIACFEVRNNIELFCLETARSHTGCTELY